MWWLYKFVYGYVFIEGFMFRGIVNNMCLYYFIGNSFWNWIVLVSVFFRLVYMYVFLYRNIVEFLNLVVIILFFFFVIFCNLI